MTWFPVIEEDFGQERFLIDQPVELFSKGNFSRVPLIIGRTQDEFLDAPRTMLDNESLMKDLNEKFDVIAPHCFFYEVGTENSRKLSKALKEAYFPFDTPIDITSYQSLSNVMTNDSATLHRIDNLSLRKDFQRWLRRIRSSQISEIGFQPHSSILLSSLIRRSLQRFQIPRQLSIRRFSC